MSELTARVDFVVVATFSVSMRLNRPFVLLRTGGVRSLAIMGSGSPAALFAPPH
jgi:hypothetical protein